MENSVEVINLSKSYDSKDAVKNISFSIKENEIIGLLGPNGCGKTTTIGMLLGLLKPSSGQIFINGLKTEKNRINILQKINFISPYIELPKKLTVKQNLIVYGKLYSVLNLEKRIEYLAEKLYGRSLTGRTFIRNSDSLQYLEASSHTFKFKTSSPFQSFLKESIKNILGSCSEAYTFWFGELNSQIKFSKLNGASFKSSEESISSTSILNSMLISSS